MTLTSIQDNKWRVLVLAAVLAAGGGGYWLGTGGAGESSEIAATQGKGEILYYYDPMFPQQKFDAPGKSPFMDMQLVPKYAGEASDGNASEPGITITPGIAQNLGIRTAEALVGKIQSKLRVTGTIEFNERDVAIVQARSGGFVQRTYRRAPSDIVPAGAPLADILVPDWGGAQAEYLALARSGNDHFATAAKERMRLLGMPDELIRRVERSGRQQSVYTVSAPIGGVIESLSVREGMTLAEGQPLAQINGLNTVWLNVAIPEARASEIRVGQRAVAELQSFSDMEFAGKVIAILPSVESGSRTLTGRIELANKGGRLRPGMFATVDMGDTGSPAILVPTEAIIATGTRNLVMLANGKGRYRPAEVKIGREGGGQTEILAGLSPGEKVIVSGQFLVDSEASLSGIKVRPIDGEQKSAPTKMSGYQTSGRIEAIKNGAVTLSHEPVPALKWPAMTMDFKLAKPGLLRGFKKGDRVTFRFMQMKTGSTITSISRAEASQ
ncbi:efflux RND transporter periplasmic adaptor subunit [uncultured Parasphingorhabdus sp.]|uniref:efflux RND transporter periplasmic adaptor subunit n=1 Tax=uncultured Parasphingorhabdus sp. TaxID=2709694 RepID=UPI0030DB1417|tara:strand:- start:12643 stop:14133 length:1491 start_codon:yes stop_codon:yes gene_type:complete